MGRDARRAFKAARTHLAAKWGQCEGHTSLKTGENNGMMEGKTAAGPPLLGTLQLFGLEMQQGK